MQEQIYEIFGKCGSIFKCEWESVCEEKEMKVFVRANSLSVNEKISVSVSVSVSARKKR
jgi:hypothetical protein